MSSVRNVSAVALMLVATACGSSTAPHGGNNPHPGVAFLAGNQQTDTVSGVSIQALVVQITHDGVVAPNQVVQFEAIGAADSTHPYAGDWVDIAPLSSNYPSAFLAETTNTQGEVNVDLFFGARAGTAPLIVKVPAFGYVDTARFTVTAGAAAGLAGGPADTAAYVNGTVKLHTSVTDRYGNPRSDPVTYAVLSGPAQLSGSTVTVTAIGRVAVTGKAGKATDTTYISGVPSGTMAAAIDNGGGIAVFGLDGSGYKVITTNAAGTVAWSPSGSSLVFDQTNGGGTGGGTQYLFAATTGGTVTQLDNSGGSIDAWPAYSHDGTWIYYTKITGSFDIWRVHPDGTADSLLTAQPGSPSSEFPSPSPDGTSLVYLVPGSGAVEILNLSTGVSTPLGVAANSTAWSPNENLIAYNLFGAIYTAHPDGTGVTTVTGATYERQLGWSPDGKWIAARNTNTGKIDLISVTTLNLILPLGFTGSLDSPTWH